VQTFSSFDGTSIAYDSRGDGDPVVLVHGFAANGDINWVQPGVVDAVVASGRRAIWLDCRGHGASGKPHDPAAYADGAMARDVSALLDHLGIDPFDLVGYSMGSAISIRLALREPRVRSVVLGGAGAGGPRAVRPASDGRSPVLDGLTADDPASIGNETGRQFRAFAESTGADLRALAAVVRARQSDGDPSGIAVPTLVLIGADDHLVGSGPELAAQIRGARCVTVGGDHLSAVAKPEFRRAIIDFLDEVAVPAS
jgi:pimeloyl-ACP methyl ester carboxylesterase